MADILRVLVVSDTLLARTGLAALLAGSENCEVVGRSAFGDELQTALDVYEAEIVLLDVGWSAENALDAIALVIAADLPLIALLADEEDATVIVPALRRASSYGVLLRENEAALLNLALQSVLNGLLVYDPTVSRALANAASLPAVTLPEALTPRENDVLQLLAQGMTNKAIAQQLGITDHTVKFHVNAIMSKLSAQSRTEAVILAARAGLILL